MSGLLITGRSCRIDAVFVEMNHILAASYGLIFQSIPTIRIADIKSYIPERISYLWSFRAVDVPKNGGSDNYYDNSEILGDAKDTGSDNEDFAVSLIDVETEYYPKYFDEDTA